MWVSRCYWVVYTCDSLAGSLGWDTWSTVIYSLWQRTVREDGAQQCRCIKCWHIGCKWSYVVNRFFDSGSRTEAKILSYGSPYFPYLSYSIAWPPKSSKKILQRLGVMTLAWSLRLIETAQLPWRRAWIRETLFRLKSLFIRFHMWFHSGNTFVVGQVAQSV